MTLLYVLVPPSPVYGRIALTQALLFLKNYLLVSEHVTLYVKQTVHLRICDDYVFAGI